MTDQDGDRAYSDARRAEGSSREGGAGLACSHHDRHDAVEQQHDGQRSRPDGPASHGEPPFFERPVTAVSGAAGRVATRGGWPRPEVSANPQGARRYPAGSSQTSSNYLMPPAASTQGQSPGAYREDGKLQGDTKGC